ncbi:DUF6327 family protein [Maribacter halichondriae]|uniref:DUF6327 family protein n=1 Tax=Maribacter halichondriae TaxID=2980554 RepID=UPI002358B478|nr:DUF6327 family protein [Maribacter sp. Hal144]
MITKYNSFEEIDARLKILRLQREIATENLKLHLNKVKSDLSPVQFFSGFKGSLQQMALTFALQKLSRLFRRTRQLELLN